MHLSIFFFTVEKLISSLLVHYSGPFPAPPHSCALGSANLWLAWERIAVYNIVSMGDTFQDPNNEFSREYLASRLPGCASRHLGIWLPFL